MAKIEMLANSSQAFAEAEAQRRQEVEALRGTIAVLNSTLDPEGVLDHILLCRKVKVSGGKCNKLLSFYIMSNCLR